MRLVVSDITSYYAMFSACANKRDGFQKISTCECLSLATSPDASGSKSMCVSDHPISKQICDFPWLLLSLTLLCAGSTAVDHCLDITMATCIYTPNVEHQMQATTVVVHLNGSVYSYKTML